MISYTTANPSGWDGLKERFFFLKIKVVVWVFLISFEKYSSLSCFVALKWICNG